MTGSFSDVITSTRDVLSLELSDFQDSGNEFNLEYEVDRRISAIFDELERWMNPDLAMLPIFQGRLTKLGNVQAFMQIADALSKTNQVHDQFEQRYGLTDIKTGYLKVVIGMPAVCSCKNSGKQSPGKKLLCRGSGFNFKFNKNAY